MTNQGIHAHHHHRVRRQIDILNNFTKKDLVGVGPPVRGENNNDDYSGNGGDDGDNDGSSQPEHADKAETSKSEQADKPRVKTIEVTEAKPTTQVSSTASKAESHKALPTSEIITHSTGLPKTQATSTAQPLITTINFNDITHDLQSTPTLTSRDAFSTIQHADATTELVPPTSAALLDSASGLSGGAKAGVAMGVIAWVGVVTALVAFLILRRRRRQPRGTEELVDNEKSPPPAPPQNMTGRPKQSLAIFNPSSPHQDLPAEPPRLAEVRPGSQFSPFKGRASMAPFSDGRIVEETPDEVAAANATALFAPKPTTPEPLSRNLTGSPASPPQTSGDHHQNPFGDPENIVVSSPEEKTKPPPRPVSKDLRNPKQESNDIPEPQKEQVSGISARNVGSEQVRKDESDRTSDGSNSRILGNQANSEPSTVQSMPVPQAAAANSAPAQSASASAEAIPYGPAYRPSSTPNIHRVLLDFDPQLDDELPLRRGRLVRILHTYDDGWALCSLMDNSAQGVAPRACLSPLPMKPRFNPGSSAPSFRPHPGAAAPVSTASNSPHSPGPLQQDPLKPLPLNTTGSPTGRPPKSLVSPVSTTTVRTTNPVHDTSRPSSEAAPGTLTGAQSEWPTSVNAGPPYSTVPKPLTPVHLRVFPPVAKATPSERMSPVAPFRPRSAAHPFLKSSQLDSAASKLSSQSDSALNKAVLAREGKKEGKRINTLDGGQSSRPSSPSFVTANEEATAFE